VPDTQFETVQAWDHNSENRGCRERERRSRDEKSPGIRPHRPQHHDPDERVIEVTAK
jgi:hypothetical protein